MVKFIIEYTPHLLSLIAVVISYRNMRIIKINESNHLRSNSIDKSYETFHELGLLRLENPIFSYLFETRDNYNEVLEKVRIISGNNTKEEDLEQLLKERAISMLIFQSFENIYYKYLNLNDDDLVRKQFLEDVLNYFTQVLLRNPRLLFLWSVNGGNLCSFFEESTREYYDLKVSQYYMEVNRDIMDFMDYKGPFDNLNDYTKNYNKAR